MMLSPESVEATRSPAGEVTITAYMPAQNDCHFCRTVHGVVPAHHRVGQKPKS